MHLKAEHIILIYNNLDLLTIYGRAAFARVGLAVYLPASLCHESHLYYIRWMISHNETPASVFNACAPPASDDMCLQFACTSGFC
jgi:hypothetical protein